MADASLLFRLPRELRDEIYRHALYNPNGFTIRQTHTGTPPKHSIEWPQHNQHQNPTALTQTSTQIRNETHALFYALNDFRFRATWSDRWAIKEWHEDISAWLDRLGPVARAALRSVTIDLGGWRMHRNPQEHEMPLPTRVAAYIRCLRSRGVPCMFRFAACLTCCVPTKNRIHVPEFDFEVEVAAIGSGESVFEQAIVQEVRLGEEACARGEMGSHAMIRLVMQLDSFRSIFADYLDDIKDCLDFAPR